MKRATRACNRKNIGEMFRCKTGKNIEEMFRCTN